MRRRLGPWTLVLILALTGCTEDDETGDGAEVEKVSDSAVAPERGPGEEIHELVVLLRDELAKKETRIAKLEGQLETCRGELQAMDDVIPAGGTGAPLLELPSELELRRMSIVDEDGEPILTLQERSGKVFVSLREGSRTIGPVALEPILSFLTPMAELRGLGLTTDGADMGLEPWRRRSRQYTVPEKFSSWIRKIAMYEYLILRSGLDRQLTNLDGLAREARIIPNYRDGTYQGFKLVGVRPGSLYRTLGIRSGDVIRTVNGEDITTPNQALTLYEALKDAQRLEFGIERRGKEILLVYQIVDEFPSAEPATAEQPEAEEPEVDQPEKAEAAIEEPPDEIPDPVEDSGDPPIEKTHEVPKIFS